MNEAQTDELRECITCGTIQMAVAPFCVFCGREPLTGRPWEPEGGPEALEALTACAEAEGCGSLTCDELERLAYAQAYLVGAAEWRGVHAVTEGGGPLDPRRLLGGKRRQAREFGEAFAMAAHHLTALHVTLDELFGRGGHEETVEEHARHYAGLVAMFSGGLVAYHGAHTDEALREVYARRVCQRIAQQGGESIRTWQPVGQEVRLPYNALVFEAVPAWHLCRIPGSHQIMGGKDSPEGALMVALVPAAWRCWFDLVLAPYSTVLVYAQTDPLAGLEWAEDETAGRGCAGYAEYMTRRYCGRPFEIRETTIGGRPAVRASLLLPYMDGLAEEAMGAGEYGERPEDPVLSAPLEDAVVEHAWVHAGERVWHLSGLSPLRGPRQYRLAVQAAIDGFECAG